MAREMRVKGNVIRLNAEANHVVQHPQPTKPADRGHAAAGVDRVDAVGVLRLPDRSHGDRVRREVRGVRLLVL